MSTKNNPNETKKAVIFARVSTEAQNYDEQINRMTAVALADGYKKENLIEISVKESAIKKSEEEREGLNLLKEAVANDANINAVYVFEISRLGRRMDVICSVLQWLTDKHIQLVCDTPNVRLFDRSGNIDFAGQLLIYICGVMAAQEMKIKKERFANGKERAKKEGRFVGGSVKFGYTLNDKKQIIVDETKTQVICNIFDMYKNNAGNAVIAEYMNENGIAERRSKTYTRSRISKFISDEAYKPIVGEKLFNECQEVRSGNYQGNRERKMALGERLIVCGECGRNFRLVGRNYVCSGHKAEYRESGAELNGKALYCDNSINLNRRYIDSTLFACTSQWYMKEVMADDSARRDAIQKELNEIPAKIAAVEKKLSGIKGRLKRIADNNEAGAYTDEEFKAKVSAVKADEKKLNAEKEGLETRQRELQFNKEKSAEWFSQYDQIDAMTHAELYELVHRIVDHVEVWNEGDKKYWKIVRKHHNEDAEIYYSCGKGAGVKLFQIVSGGPMDITKVPVYNREFAE